jgi:hypothetical protein
MRWDRQFAHLLLQIRILHMLNGEHYKTFRYQHQARGFFARVSIVRNFAVIPNW